MTAWFSSRRHQQQQVTPQDTLWAWPAEAEPTQRSTQSCRTRSLPPREVCCGCRPDQCRPVRAYELRMHHDGAVDTGAFLLPVSPRLRLGMHRKARQPPQYMYVHLKVESIRFSAKAGRGLSWQRQQYLQCGTRSDHVYYELGVVNCRIEAFYQWLNRSAWLSANM